MAEYHTDDCGDKRDYNFRPIRTRKITFKVKAKKEVAICVCKEDDKNSEDMYQIFLGCWGGHESGIRRGQSEDVLRKETEDILSEDEYRAFWIKVSKGKIKVGKKGKIQSFLSFEEEDGIGNMKYYGYCTGYGAEGDWKFGDDKGHGSDSGSGSSSSSSSSSSSAVSSSDSEAGELNELEVRPIMYKRPARWVPGHGGYMPRYPVCGGDGAEGSVYVGMACHEGGHILGMVVPGEAICYIPFGGEAIPKDDYYVLGNPSGVELSWKAGSAGGVPTGALQGGHTEDKEPLYVGRVSVDGVVSCGKVHPSHGVCYVPYGGVEHAHRDYEVLCAKGIPCRIKV